LASNHDSTLAGAIVARERREKSTMSEHPEHDGRNESNANSADDASADESRARSMERRTFLKGVATTGALGTVGSEHLVESGAAATAESGWAMKPPQMETPWTSDVGPDNAHPEYPRPQLVRDAWENLNGVWQFAGAAEGETPPTGEELDERVLVPYPVESGLSGIKRHETWMWYRRQFDVPDEWLVPTAHSGEGVGNNPNAQRLLVHFERVDWDATVYVNGEQVTRHKGGYDHFVADVTDALIEDGPQELVVGVYDPTGANYEPVGTQPKGRQGVDRGIDRGLWKMSSSGIWDTVWMEPVPETSIESLDMTPDLDAEALRLTANATDDATVVATAYDGDERVGRVTGPANEELELPVPDPHLWSPDDPFLYDLEVELRRANGAGNAARAGGGKLLDAVESYFGMRSLGMQEIDGTSRPTLNGEPIYHLGSLESGMWPDGLYTAPTDEALAANLELQTELGYNVVRKHSKVETRRWFYHTDRLGLLVWQDMPNMEEFFDTPPRDEAALEQFEAEYRDVIAQHDTHPSMAVWTPFNEGWGINNDNHEFIREMTQLTAELDPERLVDANSGYNIGSNSDSGAGDFKDMHHYGSPAVTSPNPEPDRISALGEYTSQAIKVDGHTVGEWGPDGTPEEFVSEYVDTVESLRDHLVGQRLSGSVYTATTDLYGVWNGHITYDRKVVKPELAENGLERVRNAHETLLEQAERVMGNVKIDVNAPESYGTGQFSEGAPFEVDVSLSNPESSAATAATVEDVTFVLSGLPQGWSAESTTKTAFDAVADGESATATWEVTPAGTSEGTVGLDLDVEYAIDGETYEYADEVSLTPKLLAYYRFEGSLDDSSGNGNHAAPGGGVGFDDQSVEGQQSLALDGENDYALLSGDGSGFLHRPFSERTVSMWVNPDSTDGTQTLYNEGGTVTGLAVRIQDGELQAGVINNGTAATVSTPFDRTEWANVAVVFDRGVLRLYVDGVEAATNEDVGYDALGGHGDSAEIGAARDSSLWGFDDTPFGGNVDATAIFAGALSADEIEAVTSRSFGVDAPDLYGPGEEFTVNATFSDLRAGDGTTFENLSMDLTRLPDGWTAAAETDTAFDAVPDGESVTATWEIMPGANSAGSVDLEAVVEYEVDGEPKRLVDRANLDTLSSAALADWRFDGSVADSSGNGHDASLANGASFDDETVVQGSHSVALDGDDDFVNLADSQEFLSNSFSTWSVSTWINPDDTTGTQVVYNQGAAINGLAVRVNDGTLQAATVNGGTQATVSTPFSSTDWTHVAVVFDRGVLRLYVDGEEAATNEDVGYATVSGAYWGGEVGGAEASFWSGGNLGGYVDRTAVYPIALTSDLVASLASTA
jgi:hypothetical protein